MGQQCPPWICPAHQDRAPRPSCREVGAEGGGLWAQVHRAGAPQPGTQRGEHRIHPCVPSPASVVCHSRRNVVNIVS